MRPSARRHIPTRAKRPTTTLRGSAGQSFRGHDLSVLVLTDQADETADYLCSRMEDASMRYTRVNTEAVATTCSIVATRRGVELVVDGHALTPSEVDALWYRRPMPPARGEGDLHDAAFAAAEWTAALEGFLSHIPSPRWINHPSNIMRASAKLEQLTRASEHGLNVPPWCCTSSSAHALQFLEQQNSVVAKPLYSGYIERGTPTTDTVIYTSRVVHEDLKASGASLGAPTLFQREVKDGVDVRVTVVDDEMVAVRLRREGGEIDIRRDNMVGVQYALERVPTDGVI